MPSRKSRRKTSRKSRRKTSRTSRRKTSRKSRRKTSRKSRRKTSRKSRRKTSRKSRRKTSRKSRSKKQDIVSANNKYYFQVWYKNKPKLNNKYNVINPSVKLDDDNEWIFTGDVNANSVSQVKSWLRSLGTVKRYSESKGERLEVTPSF